MLKRHSAEDYFELGVSCRDCRGEGLAHVGLQSGDHNESVIVPTRAAADTAVLRAHELRRLRLQSPGNSGCTGMKPRIQFTRYFSSVHVEQSIHTGRKATCKHKWNLLLRMGVHTGCKQHQRNLCARVQCRLGLMDFLRPSGVSAKAE